MKQSSTIELLAGGPGSGCNPAVAVPRCGRPSKEETLNDSGKWVKDGRSFTAFIDGKQVTITRLPVNGEYISASPWEVKVNGEVVAIEKKTATALRIAAENGVYTRGVSIKSVPITTTTRQPKAAPGFLRKFFGHVHNKASQVIDRAADIIKERGVSEELFNVLPPISKVTTMTGRGILGQYLSWSRKMRLNVNHHAFSVKTVLHELAHHIDFSYLDRPENRSGALADQMIKMQQEYFNAYSRVQNRIQLIGLRGKYSKAIWQINTNDLAISNYSLHDKREWFAEHFAHYVMAPDYTRERMQSITPETYKFVKNIVDGTYFKEKR